MQIYNLLKTHNASNYSLIDIYDPNGNLACMLQIKEIKHKLSLAEFKKDDGLFWASGRPDAFSTLVGATFNLKNGRKYKISWVKPIIDENNFSTVMQHFTAVLLVRRLS